MKLRAKNHCQPLLPLFGSRMAMRGAAAQRNALGHEKPAHPGEGAA